MTDEGRFETRLERALRDYAEQALLPFDPDAIAAVATEPVRRPSPWVRLGLVASVGIAAVVVLAVVAGQLLVRPLGIGGPHTIAAEDLPAIIANASNTPGTWEQDPDQRGAITLATPMRSTREPPSAGFIDGRTTTMCELDADGNAVNCILAWGALFESVGEADAAYAFYIDDFQASDGWAIPATLRTDLLDLGDEALLYTDVQDPAENARRLTGIYFWREETLLMAAVGVAEMELDVLREIAYAMQARAEGR